MSFATWLPGERRIGGHKRGEAIRGALGACRSRIILQILAEAGLIAVGAAPGDFLAHFVVRGCVAPSGRYRILVTCSPPGRILHGITRW